MTTQASGAAPAPEEPSPRDRAQGNKAQSEKAKDPKRADEKEPKASEGELLDDSRQLSADETSALMETLFLLNNARKGNTDALAELFRRYEDKLFRFVRARMSASVRRLHEPQDIVSEVRLRAFRALDSFEYKGIGSFWAWLRRIALNTIIEAHRKGDGRAAVRSLPEESHSAPADRGISPGKIVEIREEFARFEQALPVLPTNIRNALLMRLELGLPYEQIAEECAFPTSDAARMAVNRAMAQVAKEMNRLKREGGLECPP